MCQSLTYRTVKNTSVLLEATKLVANSYGSNRKLTCPVSPVFTAVVSHMPGAEACILHITFNLTTMLKDRTIHSLQRRELCTERSGNLLKAMQLAHGKTGTESQVSDRAGLLPLLAPGKQASSLPQPRGDSWLNAETSLFDLN